MSTATKPPERQAKAKKYLEEYDIEPVIGEMLNSLLHEQDPHPYVYMIKYLASYMTEEERKEFNLVIPEPFPRAYPVVKYPKFSEENTSVLKSVLTPEWFRKWKSIKTKSGNTINSVTKLSENLQSDNIGCILSDSDCINAYKPLIDLVVEKAHNVKIEKWKDYSLNTFNSLNAIDFFGLENIKTLNKIIISLSRNIVDFPFNHFSSGNDKLGVCESLITKEINSKISEKVIPDMKCLNYKDNSREIEEVLNYINYDIDWLFAANLKQTWQEHRVIYVTEDKSVIIWVNFANHIQLFTVVTNQKEYNWIETYNNLIEILKQISLTLTFESNSKFGYWTTNINLLGAGWEIKSEVTLNETSKVKLNGTDWRDLLSGLSFDKYTMTNVNGTDNIKVSSSQTCKLSEPSDVAFISGYFNKWSGLVKVFSTESPSEISFKKIELPDYSSAPKLQFLKQAYDTVFDELKYNWSANGSNINNWFNYLHNHQNEKLGIILENKGQYLTVHRFIHEYWLQSQNFDIKTTEHIHKMENQKQMIEISDEDLAFIKNVNICFYRNIEGHPFPASKNNNNASVESVIKEAIASINAKGHFADYFSFESEKEKCESIIKDNNILIYHEDEMVKQGIDVDYPRNRGVIQFDRENIFGVVNDIDHMKFFLNINNPETKLNTQLVNLWKVLNEVSKHLKFIYDMNLGFITASPFYWGTGMLVKVKLNLKIGINEVTEILEGKDFEAREEKENDETVICLWNKTTIGESETELLTNLWIVLKEIIDKSKN